jgi:hypothetical protein
VIKKLTDDRGVFKDRGKTPPAVAFFYFDFKNKEGQVIENAIRRVILQLSAQSPYPYKTLDKHYGLSDGQALPTFRNLHKILEELLLEIGRTYIVFDALDECKESDHPDLVDLISTLRQWTQSSLHLLITSQPREIFAKAFKDMPCIPLDFHATQEDIKFFVASELRDKPSLKIWADRADYITDRVVRKSNGM